MNLEVAVDAFFFSPEANIGQKKNAKLVKNSVSLHSQFINQLNVTRKRELYGTM